MRIHAVRTICLASLPLLVLTAVGCGTDSDTDGGSVARVDAGGTDGGGSMLDATVSGEEDLTIDLVDATCDDPSWTPGACAPGEREARTEDLGAAHIRLPEEIEYAQTPPSHGPHRPAWAAWGEYDYLPPQRWLHNLEHGGVALLYHPCADASLVDDLRAWAQAHPGDDGGPLRWVLTPYPGLDSAFAAVTWQNVYRAECFDGSGVTAFVDDTYRQAPEDVASDGSYTLGYVGR